MTDTPRPQSTVHTAAAKLRALILSSPGGTLLGSEDALIECLGASRPSVRQAARLLEQEGLVEVRRGINGGYFASRPSIGTIQEAVSSYMEVLGTRQADIHSVTSALWVEAVRQACAKSGAEAVDIAQNLAGRVRALPADATIDVVYRLELECREAVFALSGSAFIPLIFQLSLAYSLRQQPGYKGQNDNIDQLAFAKDWKRARLLELDAISTGDLALGALAATQCRAVWARLLPRDEAS